MINLPTPVNEIIDTLRQHGFEAYAVGGCVRDSLLGREPEDWDVTTSARPEQVKEIFPVTIDTGIEHGTVTVRLNKTSYEVTTFRIDGKYSDHRRPDEVSFARTLQEDLLRRDFTINAMAAGSDEPDGQSGIIDLYGGLADLDAGIIRCVGVPEERFNEDALRILRAFRFAAQLGFDIEPATRDAIAATREGLRAISAERIQVEMTKILISDRPGILREMHELGVTAIILPELDQMMATEQNNRHHVWTVGEHTIRSLEALVGMTRNLAAPETIAGLPESLSLPEARCLSGSKAIRWAMLLHDTGKPQCKTVEEDGQDHFKGHALISADIAREVMNRMKMDNATRDTVVRLVKYHDYRMPAEKKNVRRALAKIGRDYFLGYCIVRRADVLAQSEYVRAEKLENLDAIEALYAEIIAEDECVSLDQLAVTGRDLIEEGLEPGPAIGDALAMLLFRVIEDPSLNNKETLLAIWRDNYGSAELKA